RGGTPPGSRDRPMHGDELRPVRERRLDLHGCDHLRHAVHHVVAGEDGLSVGHKLGDAAPVAGALEHPGADGRDGFGVVQLEAAVAALLREIGGDVQHQPFLLVWGQQHTGNLMPPCVAPVKRGRMTAMAHSGANSGAQPGSRPARAVIRAEVGHGSAELVGDPDRPHGWTLLVDGTAQSHVDLDDPVHLEFEYIRRIGHLIDLCARPYAPLRALHLGGGAWTLARYVATTRPGSTQTVVELDGPLAEFVAHRLPADGMGIDVTVGDARAALASTGPGSVDLVVLDV